MKQAIVIDSSREIPLELYKEEQIFPVGYSIEDSKGQIYSEREHTHSLNTGRLMSIVNQDKKANIFAPNIKEFVELYTFLAEEYDSLISIHSSLFTPSVYEHALLAKKMVSGITIDLVDSPTIGPASGLFTAELVKFIPDAKNINEIRKKAIELNKRISAYTITENDNLVKEGKGKVNTQKTFPFSFTNHNLYHYFHTQWTNISQDRKAHNLFKEANHRINIVSKTKEVESIFYSSSSKYTKNTKDIIRRFRKVPKTETKQSIISYYVLGKEYASVAFI